MIDRDLDIEAVAGVHSRAAMMLSKHLRTSAPLDAATVHVFLPACRSCGEKHPLAFMPRLPADLCPRCGSPAQRPGEPILTTSAQFTARNEPMMLLARALLAVGNFLANLSKRLSP